MEKEIQCIRIEKHVSFPEAKQLVAAETPPICSPTSYSTDVSKKKKVSTIDCGTDLSWVSSDTPTFISDGPGSVSGSTQASSAKTGSVVADAQSLRKSARQADRYRSSGVGSVGGLILRRFSPKWYVGVGPSGGGEV